MKYFKFAQISQDTGISWAIAQPITGPSWPNIPGLNLNAAVQLSHNPIYYIAQVGNTAKANPDNHIFELTDAEYAEELKQHVMNQLNKEKDNIYTEEYNFRESIFSKYHDTASIAGVYKYQQAKELIENNDAAAPEIRAEAVARGLGALVLAARIIDNHESFRNKEAKIAGIRGKIWDRLQSFEFDLENPDASYTEFLSSEVIGTRTENVFENGEMVEKEVDVTVNKYTLALGTRFQYLD
jgi:hypothetical protein